MLHNNVQSMSQMKTVKDMLIKFNTFHLIQRMLILLLINKDFICSLTMIFNNKIRGKAVKSKCFTMNITFVTIAAELSDNVKISKCSDNRARYSDIKVFFNKFKHFKLQ